ncbi:Vacuolar protein sorting-associated protein 11 -like protein [Escovopsis weberi]|uniref:E3 ubiquitin-protein ligase PEP5 n=1 Tax=Escovopsis weberi TaxID=150374 RepID=A0A0M8N7M4_ESCWE|nr:Vacuolar protein sorting-associated protein 11 -like protein [Escovopsis weberi]
MAISWKSFDFFDVSQVSLPDPGPLELLENHDISSICAGSDSLFFGSNDGYVSIIGKSWKVAKRFQAHETGAITYMRQVEGTSILVTVAEDMSSEPVLKAWALDKLVKKTDMPTCLSTLNISNGRRQFPISAFAALDDLTQIAVGFANGAVTVIRGDLIHDLGTKQRIVYESDEPVTGVQLATHESSTTLFVSTTSRILRLGLSKRGQGLPPKVMEDAGCAAGCMTFDPKTGDVVVARDDAIYTYRLDGRGPPRAYESPKQLISVYRNYMAVACPPSTSNIRDPEAVRRRFGSAAADSLFNVSTFVLLETDLRVIGHTETLISPVRFVFEIWGDLFTVTEEGKIYRYHEKALQQRLELLYQRNMFPLAIELAQNAGMDSGQQSLIYRRFGDYLYQKGDFDGAMNQYIRAIDSTEPSQVIRKFLDTQRIHNLIQYLEQLHEQRRATADHTTLLLNCYAKLKDIKKLESFIMSPGDLKFDLDTAITMCRQGGYYQQAAFLAKKHGETELVVDILIEDSKSYGDALNYIWHQDPEVAFPCLQRYARVLIEHCPKDATKLFVDYYTGKYRPRKTVMTVESTEAPAVGGFGAGAASAVQNLTSLLALPSYISPLNGATSASDAAKEVAAPTADEEEDAPAPKYNPPAPRTAFSSFIDHPDEFIEFLEACLEEEKLKEEHSADLYTTLFEMYLCKSNEKKGHQHKEEWEAKAKKLIEGEHVPMESSNVLLLSHLSSFQDGTVLVKEQAGLLSDIFRSYTSAKDTRGALKALRKYGPEEPQLYPAALAYLTSDARVLEEAGADELAAILAKIDKDGLMAPLQVIQTLVGQTGGGGGVATMGMIKPYLQETIARERKEIASNRHRIATLRTDTEKRRGELDDLSNKPAVFQATRCSDCGQGLDLPAVHFLCKHSFHQRCLRGGGSEEETECPKCAPENEVIRKMREGQRERAGRHELFKSDLEAADDRFATISEWFSRGVMDGQNVDPTS